MIVPCNALGLPATFFGHVKEVVLDTRNIAKDNHSGGPSTSNVVILAAGKDRVAGLEWRSIM